MSLKQKVAGFTMLELMAVLMVAAIMIAFAVPGFQNLTRSNRAEAQLSSFLGALTYARAEAVKRATNVYVSPLNAAGWQGGWRVWVDQNADTAFTNADFELQTYPAFTGVATLTNGGAATQFAFDRSGYSLGAGVGATTAFAFRVDASSCDAERDITINHLGRVIVQPRDCE